MIKQPSYPQFFTTKTPNVIDKELFERELHYCVHSMIEIMIDRNLHYYDDMLNVINNILTPHLEKYKINGDIWYYKHTLSRDCGYFNSYSLGITFRYTQEIEYRQVNIKINTDMLMTPPPTEYDFDTIKNCTLLEN